MSPKATRVPVVPVDALRARILDASIELIEKDGLEALSLREVARRAGVSHQAPYHHFADREAILAAICERGFEMLGERIAAARKAGTGPTDCMELAAVAYIDFAAEHSAHFRVMFRPELVHLNQHADAQKAADCAFTHVPEMIADAMRAGLPVEPSAEAMTATIWSFVHGYACLLLDGPLAMKFPSVAVDRRKAIRDAARALRCLLDAATACGQSGVPAAPARRAPTAAKAKVGRKAKTKPATKRA